MQDELRRLAQSVQDRQLASRSPPAEYAALLGSLFEGIRNGWDAHVSTGVETVLGRPARSFAEWVADHAANEVPTT